jgi:hypothetical protein
LPGAIDVSLRRGGLLVEVGLSWKLILQKDSLMEHLWGGGRRTGPAVGLSVDRIKISCLPIVIGMVTFCGKTKSDTRKRRKENT